MLPSVMICDLKNHLDKTRYRGQNRAEDVNFDFPKISFQYTQSTNEIFPGS